MSSTNLDRDRTTLEIESRSTDETLDGAASASSHKKRLRDRLFSPVKRLNYRIARAVLRWLIRPSVLGIDNVTGQNVVYALANRSLSDVITLDLVSEDQPIPSPTASLDAGATREQRRFFFLNRGTGVTRRHTMRTYSRRMLRLENALIQDPKLQLTLIPVSVFWGRAANKDRSVLRSLVSDDWTVTSRLRRFLSLFFNRSDILVQFGTPIGWHAIIDPGMDQNRMTRRTARLLRVRFRKQRTVALGPDLSHRRTLLTQILNARAVQDVIKAESNSRKARRKLAKAAYKHANAIASDMSYPVIRMIDRALTWFWNRIYDGVEVRGVDRLSAVAGDYTLVYTPSHRSHIDYLLLSYMLFHGGFWLPHIAAGDNLNMPILGGILRRGGAFFMRRSFASDKLYAAIFSEYLYQVFRRGHSVEYFIEGGRTRTGRLLDPKTGMLRMTIQAATRGLPRPICFVPVYIGYEKLIEANSYLNELRGGRKKRESVADVFRNLRLIKQDFGKVYLNFGQPLPLDTFLEAHPDNPRQSQMLAFEILRRVNACATVNPMNLVALVTLSMPKQAIDEQMLSEQIDCFKALITMNGHDHDYEVSSLSAEEIIRHTENLGLLQRDPHDYGDILSHDPFSAVLMTWYRNNVLHVVSLPSLIACLLINRRRRLAEADIHTYVGNVYPYVARELYVDGGSQEKATEAWLQHLCQLRLIVRHADGTYSAADQHAPEHVRLRLLANVVMQILERFFIVIGLLVQSGSGTWNRRELLTRCQVVAERMSRIYGINSPEFFDTHLFENFIETMIAGHALSERDEGKLHYEPIVVDVVRAAQGVISAEFRQAVLRPRQ